MKVVILGKGEMLANLIEGVKESNSDIVGVFRYERTIYSDFRLFLHDFFRNLKVLIFKTKENEKNTSIIGNGALISLGLL